MTAPKKRRTSTGAIFLVALVVCLFGESAAQDFNVWAFRIRSGSTEEKREVLFQIRNLQTVEASRIAVPALRDKNEIVRATATQAVIFLPSAEALPELLPLLQDKSPLVRKETVYALGKIKDPNAVEPLLTVSQNDKDLEVRAVSLAAVGEIGDVSAVAALIKFLQQNPKEEEDFIRRSAARSIGQIAQIQQFKVNYVVTPESFLAEKYEALVNLKYSNLSVRFPSFGQAVDVLQVVLQNPKEADDVRREAAFALGAIGDARAVGILSSNLQARDYYLAEICRESLRKLQTVADSDR